MFPTLAQNQLLSKPGSEGRLTKHPGQIAEDPSSCVVPVTQASTEHDEKAGRGSRFVLSPRPAAAVVALPLARRYSCSPNTFA